MATDDSDALDNKLAKFATYEEYLDDRVFDRDRYFLEDEDLARQLSEYGFLPAAPERMDETLKREEFEAQKRAGEEARLAKQRVQPKVLASWGKDLSASPFLAALHDREEWVRNGKLTSIIFIRDYNAKNQEVSGYIDYAHRLKTENFEVYFDGRKKLLPKPSDLSFYNWKTQTSTSNSSPNFEVIAHNENGLEFKNKRDRKVINVDPNAKSAGDNSERKQIETTEYVQVVIYDHWTRRKT